MRDWPSELEEDLKWREAELATMKLIVIESSDDSVRKTAVLRAMWAMLYAHFEGFSKFAWDLYLEALVDQGMTREQVKECIGQLSMLKEFKTLRGDWSATSLWEFCNSRFGILLKTPLAFELKPETKSNLSPDIYRENALSLDLPCSMIDEYDSKMKALVFRRNEIAHGQKMIVTSLGEYQEYEHATILVMHELAVAVVESLERKSYLAPHSALDTQPATS